MFSKIKSPFHHAYIIEADFESVRDDFENFIVKEFEMTVRGNPDFHVVHSEIFNMDEALLVSEKQQRVSVSECGKKIIVLAFNFITLSAQNAMLKILEEPTDGTHIFLITPSSHVFLPTVLSRVEVVRGNNIESGELYDDADEFLKMNYNKRLEFSADFATDVKDEKKSRIDVVNFINHLEKRLYSLSKNDKTIYKSLNIIEKGRRYIYEPSSSVKMILEHLALVLPLM